MYSLIQWPFSIQKRKTTHKYLAIVYTSTHQSSLNAYEAKPVAYLKVDTLSFRHRITIYKHFKFLTRSKQPLTSLLLKSVSDDISNFCSRKIATASHWIASFPSDLKGKTDFSWKLWSFWVLFGFDFPHLNKTKTDGILTLQTLPTRERIVLSDVPLSCDVSRKKK